MFELLECEVSAVLELDPMVGCGSGFASVDDFE